MELFVKIFIETSNLRLVVDYVVIRLVGATKISVAGADDFFRHTPDAAMLLQLGPLS